MTRPPMVWKTETQVNTSDAPSTGGNNTQYNPQITALDDGGYLVVWADESRTHYSRPAIIGQRYDVFGEKVGGEVDLSQPAEAATVSSFSEPAVTTLDDGKIALAFTVTRTNGTKEIYLETYNSDLTHFRQFISQSQPGSSDMSLAPVSGEYFATSYTNADGDAYFLRHMIGGSGGASGVPQELGDGLPDGGGAAVDIQDETQLARLSSGGHVVVFQDQESGSANHDIWVATYNANGTRDDIFTVANTTGVNEAKPDVAVNEDGTFVIVWHAPSSFGGTDIFFASFDENGIFIHQDQLTFASGNQHDASVTALDNGFLVMWSDDAYVNSSGQNTGAIKGVRLEEFGAETAEFVISETCTGLGFLQMEEAQATLLSDGRVAIATHSATNTDYDVVTSIWDLRDELIVGDEGSTITSRPDGAILAGHHLIGLGGPDVLKPIGFAASAFGGGGNDTIMVEGNIRHLTYDGGAGFDRLMVTGSDPLVVGSFGTFAAIEQWVGNGAGILPSNAGTSSNHFDFSGLVSVSDMGPIRTGSHEDSVIGTSTHDQIFGETENDTLDGRGGNDTVNGGAHNDALTGGLGRDTLFGETGADRFDFNSRSESVKGGNRDQIRDFSRGQGDKIDLSTIDADTASNSGNDKFKFIGTASFKGGGGELRCSGGIIQGDINGDKKADFEIKVNVGTLASSDFFL